MSENKSYSLIDLPEIPEQFCEAIADAFNDTTTPARKEIGDTFGNLFYMVFGGLNHYAQKKRVIRSTELKYFEQKQDMAYHSDLEHYISEISDKVNSIPDTKLREPKLDIVGPALDASKYYISNEEIRNMFSNLIAASMNTDTNEKVHHSFVEIIKQLSPLDASNLALINSSTDCPIAEYRMINKSGNHVRLQTHVFLDNTVQQDIKTQATSLSNLLRLGMINIDYSSHIANDNRYSKFFSEPTLMRFKSDLGAKLVMDPDYEYTSIDIQKGVISITPMGQDFTNICI